MFTLQFYLEAATAIIVVAVFLSLIFLAIFWVWERFRC